MDQYSAEKGLAIFYPLIILLSFICTVCSTVLWNHWKYVLDLCPETNCGCFLYGRSTYSTYEGGHIAYCHFAAYGMVFPIIFSLIFGSYHVYRVCMGKGKPRTGTATVRQRSCEVVVVTTEAEMLYNEISPNYWKPATVVSCFMLLYMLVYSSIYTDGFETSCKQYRETVLKQIQGFGNIVPVIKGRLSCAAIFDFMDYLEKEIVTWDRRRYGRINSAACFYITLVGAWMIVFSWLIITVINIIQLRRSRALRV
ncbi:uncharacterized protein LOC129606145 [Condylostylus longicornis]|uniref:uncharacterized protein LOC129606145 n=1 Tax=Condylostylus longicornis TaxID=2530218 RepID=UPI00244D9C14|nr:uncharacterized protein LOC129606145 [Condylostylus longicornis]